MSNPANPKIYYINERIDRLPVWPYPWLVLVVIGASFFFAFFDIVTIGFSLPIIIKQFDVTASYASWAVTSSLIGYIIGSLFYSRIGDHFGRKTGLYLSVSTFSVGALISGFSPNMEWLIFWRLIAGMGIGAEISLATTYLGELSPAKLRGRYTGWAITAAFAGFATVPFIALALVPNYHWGWRLLLVLGGVGGVLIAIMRRNIPESARWLSSHGQMEKADAIVSTSEAYIELKTGKKLPEPYTSQTLSDQRDLSIQSLFFTPLFSRILLFGSVWFFYYIGNYAWLTLTPELLQKKGVELTQSISHLTLTGVGFLAGAILAVFISDKFERKNSVAFIAFIWTILLLLIGYFPSDTMLVIAGFFASMTIGLLIPILYTYTGENFPTKIRATGISITDGVGHLGGAFCGQIVFLIYNHFGFSGAMTGMAVTGLIAGLLVLRGKKNHPSFAGANKLAQESYYEIKR